MAMGTTEPRSTGVATSSPSTAESTLMAGVMIPSPTSSPAASTSNPDTIST